MVVRWTFKFVILSIFIFGFVKARLKKGRYPQFINFCRGNDIYVGLPWDCQGYIHCQNANGMKMSYWQPCSANLYFDFESKTCNWPKNAQRPCPRVRGK